MKIKNYETGADLPGTASRALIHESAQAPVGAVPAYLDESGEWIPVAPSEVDHHRRHLGLDVVTVFVEP